MNTTTLSIAMLRSNVIYLVNNKTTDFLNCSIHLTKFFCFTKEKKIDLQMSNDSLKITQLVGNITKPHI